MESQSDAAAVRLPLSCGTPRQLSAETEAGAAETVTVLDVVFAEVALNASARDPRLKALLCDTALRQVCAKHGWSLDPQYKLPRRRVYGPLPLPPQRVQVAPEKPLISELPPPPPQQDAPSFPLRLSPRSPLVQPLPPPPPPPPSLSFEGTPAAWMLARMPLPLGCSPRLMLLRGRLALADADCGDSISELALPFESEADGASAWVEEGDGGRAVVARLPVLPYATAAPRLQRHGGAVKGALDIGAASYLELIA
jgi:hypothetical protein